MDTLCYRDHDREKFFLLQFPWLCVVDMLVKTGYFLPYVRKRVIEPELVHTGMIRIKMRVLRNCYSCFLRQFCHPGTTLAPSLRKVRIVHVNEPAMRESSVAIAGYLTQKIIPHSIHAKFRQQ